MYQRQETAFREYKTYSVKIFRLMFSIDTVSFDTLEDSAATFGVEYKTAKLK